MSLLLQTRLNHSTAPTEVKSEIALLASVKAIEQEKEKARNPVDLVIVLDVSGSMAGEKLNLCKKTLEFLVDQLSERDFLGLVTFDTHVKVVFPGGKMTRENKNLFLAAVRSLRDGSSTNLSGGLFSGIDLMKSKGTNDVAAICLLTDGQMNAGETDRTRLVSIAKSLIDSFDSPGMFASLFSTASSTTKRAKPSVFTFGYGSDADVTTLTMIAEGTGGNFYQIHNPESVPLSFADCLGGLTQVAAQNLEMTCELVGGGAEFANAMTSFPVEKLSASLYKVMIKDMYCGESRDILFKVAIPKGESAVEIRVSVKYIDTVHGKPELARDVARVARKQGGELPQGPGDLEVARHVIRMEATKAMEDARKEAERGNYAQASSQMHSMFNAAKMQQQQFHLDDDAMLTELCQDLEETSVAMKSQHTYETVGRAQASAAMMSHTTQRSNKVDSMMSAGAESRNAYATTRKKSMMSHAKSAFGYE